MGAKILGTLDRDRVAGNKLEEGIVSLIREKPVFGFILTRMSRIQGKHLVPTMGVRPTLDKNIQLQYNPDFVKRLTETQLAAILEHEVLHLLNEHFLRQRGREDERWNVACDMAINQYIDGLPEGCIKLLEGLEAEREAEYYYDSEQVEEMTQRMQAQGGHCGPCPQCGGSGRVPDPQGEEQDGQGDGGGQDGDGTDDKEQDGSGGGGQKQDQGPTKTCPNCKGHGYPQRGSHDGWGTMDGDVEVEAKVRDLVKNAVNDAKRQGRGTVPSWMEEMIRRIVAPPIKWNILLRSGISEEVTPEPEETFRRCHRRRQWEVNGRLEDIYPGYKRRPQSELTCAIDTSGSMGPEELGEILNELNYLSRSGYYPIELIHCDADITKVEVYNGKNEIIVHGRGGTTFTPVLEYMKKKPPKEGFKPTLIYFTDGWGENPADNGYTNRFKTIWVVTRNGSADHVAQFGTIIQMEKHRRA